MRRGVTLLWALRSPCNLSCQYCYFGTVEEQSPRGTASARPGTLSHIRRDDLPLCDMMTFISTFPSHCVNRVFVAGGEPLVWRGTLSVLTGLKARGCEVIVCSNGLPLQKVEMCRALLDLLVDAISISLDSHDAHYNDYWRRDKSGQGWHSVVRGIQTLVQQRNARRMPTQIGVYSVISQQNLDHIVDTGRFVADLGVDYFIVQPISLTPDHTLHDELSLDARHKRVFVQQVQQLRQVVSDIHLAHPEYIQQVITTLTSGSLPMTKGCFGGRDLFFIEPNGSIWDCPSVYKIQSTLPDQYLSIKNASAEHLFSQERRCRNTDCSHF
ncbi:MAG TPA: radical SAM protein, partial [Ktedonobacteraceae bacterium]|nr:radical SAM protein [Ktedonobacteraceae bacterium]